jgi:phosphoribosylformylglycinamidine synthase
MGAELDPLSTAQAFGEDQGRYLITTAPGAIVPNAVAIGKTGGAQISGKSLTDLRTAHEGFFPKLMA